jgi:hypothetical protein
MNESVHKLGESFTLSLVNFDPVVRHGWRTEDGEAYRVLLHRLLAAQHWHPPTFNTDDSTVPVDCLVFSKNTHKGRLSKEAFPAASNHIRWVVMDCSAKVVGHFGTSTV